MKLSLFVLFAASVLTFSMSAKADNDASSIRAESNAIAEIPKSCPFANSPADSDRDKSPKQRFQELQDKVSAEKGDKVR